MGLYLGSSEKAKINIVKMGGIVKPIEITKNGVYDATVGGLKYGETVNLKENIDIAELNALFEKAQTNGNVVSIYSNGVGEIYVEIYVLEFEGVKCLVMIRDDYDAELLYVHDPILCEMLGLSTEAVGHWVSGADMQIVPAPTLTLCTEEQFADCIQSPFTADDLTVFCDCMNKSDCNGYNPVTVNVPIPEGYHRSDVDVPVYPEDIPLGFTVYANGEKIEGTNPVPSGTLVYGTQDDLQSYYLSFPENLYTRDEYTRFYPNTNDGAGSYVNVATEITAGASYAKADYDSSHTITVYNSQVLKDLSGLPYLKDKFNDDNVRIRTVNDLNIRGCTTLYEAFRGYALGIKNNMLYKVSVKHTENVTETMRTFYATGALTSVKGIDMRNVTNAYDMFYYCTALTELELKNIAISLVVGSGSAYGHLLTVESLIGLLGELRNTGSVKTLSIGSTNLNKLNFYYPYNEQYPQDNQPLRVKLIEITDEMRAEDEFIDEKLPFEVCTQAEAWGTNNNSEYMTYAQYLTLKNWRVQ